MGSIRINISMALATLLIIVAAFEPYGAIAAEQVNIQIPIRQCPQSSLIADALSL